MNKLLITLRTRGTLRNAKIVDIDGDNTPYGYMSGLVDFENCEPKLNSEDEIRIERLVDATAA